MHRQCTDNFGYYYYSLTKTNKITLDISRHLLCLTDCQFFVRALSVHKKTLNFALKNSPLYYLINKSLLLLFLTISLLPVLCISPLAISINCDII